MTFAPEGSKPGQEGIVRTGSRLSRVRRIMCEGRHLMTKHCGLLNKYKQSEIGMNF